MLINCPSCGWLTEEGKYCKECGEELHPKKRKEKMFNPNENYKRPRIIKKRKIKTNLTTCRTCGQEVASSAKTCPHCGESYPDKNLNRIIVIGGVIGVMIFIFGTYFTLKFINHQTNKIRTEISNIPKINFNTKKP